MNSKAVTVAGVAAVAIGAINQCLYNGMYTIFILICILISSLPGVCTIRSIVRVTPL